MALDGCGQICKWTLILINLLGLLLGLLLVGAGVYLRVSAEGPLNLDLKTQHFILVTSLMIGVGVGLIFTAVAGDIGCCYENKSALSVCAGMMTVLVMLTAIAGFLAFTKVSEFTEHIGEFYATIYAQYLIKQDIIRQGILKFFHSTFDCCGLGGTIQTIMGQTEMCPQNYNMLGFKISTSENCVTAILGGVNGASVLGGFLGVAAVMIVCIVCCSFVYYQLRRSTSTPPPYVLLTSSTPLSPSSIPVTSSTSQSYPSIPLSSHLSPPPLIYADENLCPA